LDISALEKIFDEAKITDARQVLSTDFSGRIVQFVPPQSGMVWGDIFYIQNLIILQRLQQVDSFLKRGEVLLNKLEKNR
jgi:hypothetical protein